MVESKKCWQCGSRAKWQWTIYWVKTGFHADIFLCNREKCHKKFKDNNKDKYTKAASYHDVN